MTYLRQVLTSPTPQSEPLVGREQVLNNAGGYVFKVDDFTRLERFLVLGSEGGSYYVQERPLTLANTEAVRRAIVQDGQRVVQTIVEFSTQGRIAKNSTALYALALASTYGDEDTRVLAVESLARVARTGSHLLEFVSYADALRGWGRLLKWGVASWYDVQSPRELALQVTKYRNRSGWTHRDVLRSIHMRPPLGKEAIFRYIVKGEALPNADPIIKVAVAMQEAVTEAAVELIREHALPWEMVPSTLMGNSEIWRALSESMPPNALLRNLATLTRHGILKPLDAYTAEVAERLTSPARLRQAYVHPLQVFGALMTYQSGQGVRGQTTWTPVPQVVSALEGALEITFAQAEPSYRRFYLGVDVSGSMNVNGLGGYPNLTSRDGASALAMVLARVEPNYYAAGFCHEMRDLGITARDSFREVVRKTGDVKFGGTDCALPMLDALEKRLSVDCFVILTDGETWAGSIHPTEALRRYRREMGIPAKLVVVSLTGNEISIADPEDAGQLDVVGFDTNLTKLITDFAKE